MRNLLTSGQQSMLNNPEAIIDADDPYGGRPVEVKLCYVPPEEYTRSKELEPQERASSRRTPERHTRKCSVCNHPEREAIEEDFIHWHSPINIASHFNIADHSSIYRHAHAAGLFNRRKQNLRFVLENLMDRVDRVSITAGSVIRAVRVYTRINDRGDWVQPPSTHIILNPGVTHPGKRIKRRKSRVSNRQSKELKRGATR